MESHHIGTSIPCSLDQPTSNLQCSSPQCSPCNPCQDACGQADQATPAADAAVSTIPAPSCSQRPEAAEYECCICCDLLVDPVVFPCGHDTCSSCYTHWLEQQHCRGLSAVCPLCRVPLPAMLGVSLRLKRTVETLYPEASKARRVENVQRMQERALQFIQARIQESSQPALACAYYSQTMMAQWAQMNMAAALASGMGMGTFPQQQQQQQASPSATGAEVAVGMPVLGMVQASAPWANLCINTHLQQQQQQEAAPSVAPTSDDVISQAVSSADSPTPRRQLQRWQSAGDAQMRLECARHIMRMLRERGLQSMLGARLLPAVRLLEVTLYRSAKSKAQYQDPATLEARVVAFVRQRAAVAAASRRSASAAAAVPPPSSPRAGCAVPHVASSSTLAAATPVL